MKIKAILYEYPGSLGTSATGRPIVDSPSLTTGPGDVFFTELLCELLLVELSELLLLVVVFWCRGLRLGFREWRFFGDCNGDIGFGGGGGAGGGDDDDVDDEVAKILASIKGDLEIL